jgi:hypothetical protein
METQLRFICEYGVKGVPATTNKPGARRRGFTWKMPMGVLARKWIRLQWQC